MDALGYLVSFVILPGRAHDLARRAGPYGDLMEGLSFGALVGHRAFHAEWLPGERKARGAAAVISSRRNRTEPRDHDREMYRWRRQIENFFARIKEFPAVATRCDRTDESFAAAIHLVAGVVAATEMSTGPRHTSVMAPLPMGAAIKRHQVRRRSRKPDTVLTIDRFSHFLKIVLDGLEIIAERQDSLQGGRTDGTGGYGKRGSTAGWIKATNST